jgi:hypothetical protein
MFLSRPYPRLGRGIWRHAPSFRKGFVYCIDVFRPYQLLRCHGKQHIRSITARVLLIAHLITQYYLQNFGY